MLEGCYTNLRQMSFSYLVFLFPLLVLNINDNLIDQNHINQKQSWQIYKMYKIWNLVVQISSKGKNARWYWPTLITKWCHSTLNNILNSFTCHYLIIPSRATSAVITIIPTFSTDKFISHRKEDLLWLISFRNMCFFAML